MSKNPSRPAAARRRLEIRHARRESLGHVIRCLQQAGPKAVHTVRSVAGLLYGDDCTLQARHISAARRMIDEIQKLQLPLEPCDETGLLIDKATAAARAKSGRMGRWRYVPVGSPLGEAILEGMGDKPLETAAIAVLTLESANVPNRAGVPELDVFLEAIRTWIPRAAFEAAANELARRRARTAGGDRGGRVVAADTRGRPAPGLPIRPAAGAEHAAFRP